MTSTNTNYTAGVTLWIVEGGVDLLIRKPDQSIERLNVPVGALADFSHDRKKCSLVPTGGERPYFTLKLGAKAKPVKLYLQTKGHYFGSFEQEAKKEPWSMDQLLAAQS